MKRVLRQRVSMRENCVHVCDSSIFNFEEEEEEGAEAEAEREARAMTKRVKDSERMRTYRLYFDVTSME